jgi:hypothetical protein
MRFLLLSALFFSFSASAQNDDTHVINLPTGRTVFTFQRDLVLPSERHVEMWFQNGVVTPENQLRRDLPACTLRHNGRGVTIPRGTRYTKPRTPNNLVGSGLFRLIPIDRDTGLAIDCAAQIDFNRFGAYHNGSDLTIGQLRQAIGRTISVTILPR